MSFPPPQRLIQANAWRSLVRLLVTFVVLLAVAVRPVAAQSILRDAETEALLQDMMDPLLVAAGLQPGQVRVHLLGERSINA
ncbi:MAG: M48 family metalloprotease, partial [Sphingopyxis sp.]